MLLQYFKVFLATTLLVLTTFFFLVALAGSADIELLTTVFSSFLLMLEKTPLSGLSQFIISMHKTIPALLLVAFATAAMIASLYIEYYVVFADRGLERLPLEMKADEWYRQGKLRRARQLYEKLGRWDRLADIYRAQGQFEKAARMLERLGGDNMALAAEIYDQNGAVEKARRCWTNAARYFLSRQEWDRSANYFLKAGLKKDALECYERQYRDIQGVSLPDAWRDKCRRIIQLADQLGEIAKAARYAELIQDYSLAASFYLRAGQNLKAGEIFFNQKEYDRALECLVQIQPDTPDFEASLLGKARVLVQKERYVDALRHYLDYFKKVKPAGENLEDFFQMGAILEKLGRLKQARDVFSRIHGIRPYFMNVDMKIEAIDNKHRETEEMTALIEKDSEQKNNLIPEAFLDRIGERYGDLEELGRGGAGIVFRATDKLLGRIVALKQLPESVTRNQTRLQAFFTEAKAVAKLNHPNIVAIYDLMKSEQKYFLVMEYVPGVNVEKLMEMKGPLTARFALQIARQVLGALAYAHRLGVVHQDIKPANIMISEDKNVKLTDFGIATLQDELPGISTDVVVGTPKYISPEQLRGIPVDGRCDIYSFGITLYEMLTGNLPFPLDGILTHHLLTPPAPLRKFVPSLAPELEKVVLKCLEKDREARFESVTQLIAAMKELIPPQSG